MRVDALPEEQVAHGRVADHHHFVDGQRIYRKLLDGVRQVTCQRAPQQLAGVLVIVLDAGHHVGAAETLRVLEGGIGDHLAGFEVEETQHHRRGTQIHGQTVNRAVRAFDFDSVDEDSVAVASHGRIEWRRLVAHWEPERVALDPHMPPPHGMAADVGVLADHPALTREPKVPRQVLLEDGGRRQEFRALADLDYALLALALLAAGRGHQHVHPLGVLEKRQPGYDGTRVPIDCESASHAAAESSLQHPLYIVRGQNLFLAHGKLPNCLYRCAPILVSSPIC